MNSKLLNSKYGLNFCRPFFRFSLTVIAIMTLPGCGGGEPSKTLAQREATSVTNTSSYTSSQSSGVVLAPRTGENPIPTASPDLLPKVSAGPRQFADPNVILHLRGTAVAGSGTQIMSTLWTQVTGPTVIIPSPYALESVVLVPDVSVATQLEFRFTAYDSEGRQNSATTSIVVKPAPAFLKIIGGVFAEADPFAIFKIRLNAPSLTPISFSYTTQDGSAMSVAKSGTETDDVDYRATSGEIVFAPGEVLKEISVPLVNDLIDEANEIFSLQITGVNGAETHANTGVAIIHDDDLLLLPQAIQFGVLGPIKIYSDQTYTNPIDSSAPGTGAITYSSSDESIAIVNERGGITAVSVGETTITATKLGDGRYSPASSSYALQVRSRGSAPMVDFVNAHGRTPSDGTSLQYGDPLELSGYAYGLEDGDLPITERWTSDVDGVLSDSDRLNATSLTQGIHFITYSATDSDQNVGSITRQFFVGNIAPLATVETSIGECSIGQVDCSLLYRINDGDLDTAFEAGYGLDNDTDLSDVSEVVIFTWESPITFSRVDIFTTNGALRDYTIQYRIGDNLQSLDEVVDNSNHHQSHVTTPISTTELVLTVYGGALAPPLNTIINEVAVFGSEDIPPALTDWAGTYEISTDGFINETENFNSLTVGVDGSVTMGITKLENVDYFASPEYISWPTQVLTDSQGNSITVGGDLYFTFDGQGVDGVLMFNELESGTFVGRR